MKEIFEKAFEYWKSIEESEKELYLNNLNDIDTQAIYNEVDEIIPDGGICPGLKEVIEYYNSMEKNDDTIDDFEDSLTELRSKIARSLSSEEDMPDSSKFEKKVLEHIQESDGDYEFSEEENEELAKAYKAGGDHKYAFYEDDDDEEYSEDYDEDEDDDYTDELLGEDFVLYVYRNRVYITVDDCTDSPLFTFSDKFQKKVVELIENHFNKK